jgi:hypothetical protein
MKMKNKDKIKWHLLEGPVVFLLCLAIFFVYDMFVDHPAALIIAGVILAAFFVSELYHSILIGWEYGFRRRISSKTTRVQSVDGTEKLGLFRFPYLKVRFSDDTLGNRTYRVINLPDFEILPDQKVEISYLEKSRTVLKIAMSL